MDLMVMENLFYKRSISRVYDLKGSSRSRYIPDTSGTDKVLLDMNLLETLRTKPIFLGSKAKRSLERAIWNDTSFLAVSIFFPFNIPWLLLIFRKAALVVQFQMNFNSMILLNALRLYLDAFLNYFEIWKLVNN